MSDSTLTAPSASSYIDGADTLFVIGTAIFTSLLSEGKSRLQSKHSTTSLEDSF